MSLDFPAAGQALWSISDQTGVRPEYLLPVLYLESSFNPGAVNSIGCVGLNQQCPPNVPAGYAQMAASQQLAGTILAAYRADVAALGPIRSATRAYQANFLPATLKTARELGSVLAARGSSRRIPGSQLTEASVYAQNAGLDADASGAITVGDLAAKMRQMVGKAAVQGAIAQTYALRPGAAPDPDPVLGADFAGFWGSLSTTDLVLGAVAVAAAAGFAAVEVWPRIRDLR